MPDEAAPIGHSMTLVEEMRTKAAQEALTDQGLMWSFLRDCMNQGSHIWQDSQRYEEFSAKLDASAAQRGRHLWDALQAALATARQEGQREALERAAKAQCYRCGHPCEQWKPAVKGWDGRWRHAPGDDYTGPDVLCEADAIRALAGSPDGGATEQEEAK